MSNVTIHTWMCDGCHRLSFRPALQLHTSVDHPLKRHERIHLCEDCAKASQVICLSCYHVHRASVLCDKFQPVYQLSKDLL